jgi:hypothetical protein
LQQRLAPAARRRSARGAVAELLDDTRDPFTVVILAGDDDDAAALEVDGGWENAAVPERVNRVQPAGGDALNVLGAADLPRPGRSEGAQERISEGGDGGDSARFLADCLHSGLSPIRKL